MLRAASDELGHEEAKAADKKVGFKQTPGRGYEFFGLRLESAEKPEHRRAAEPEDVVRNLQAGAEAAGQSDRVIVYVHHHRGSPLGTGASAGSSICARMHRCRRRSIVSHGVPMLQGIEIYKGAPRSTAGQFHLHTYQPAKYTDERIWQSVIAKSFFAGRALERIELYPIGLGGEDALTTARYDARRVPHIAGRLRGEDSPRLASMSEAFADSISK